MVDKKAVHRPAMDRLRQSVFSSLGAEVEDAAVCDLFAGTGSYGLEALSRGARSATFVELNRQAIAMIKQNLAIVEKSMQARLEARVIASDVTKWNSHNERFELVFVDPPYDVIRNTAPQLFPLFDTILYDRGTVAFELPGQIELNYPGWTLRKRLGKGANQPTICLFERDSARPA